MSAGKLDHRITLERVTRTPDAFSTAGAETWAPIATVWAKAEQISDGEKWRAAAIEVDATHRFLIRYSRTAETLTAADRILFNGKIHNLVGKPKEIGRREWLEITAKAKG